ncbi:hypothetical protein IFR05_015248 [Cadophora sp. M221]|nr:hypothetical protein IFR05_015248 [Cadophora sp. M221]
MGFFDTFSDFVDVDVMGNGSVASIVALEQPHPNNPNAKVNKDNSYPDIRGRGRPEGLDIARIPGEENQNRVNEVRCFTIFAADDSLRNSEPRPARRTTVIRFGQIGLMLESPRWFQESLGPDNSRASHQGIRWWSCVSGLAILTLVRHASTVWPGLSEHLRLESPLDSWHELLSCHRKRNKYPLEI